VIEENKFQGKFSSESEMSELGKMMGADYVCVISIINTGTLYYVYCKQVDVKNALIENSGEGKTAQLSELIFAADESAIFFAANEKAFKRELNDKRNASRNMDKRLLGSPDSEARSSEARTSSREIPRTVTTKNRNNYMAIGISSVFYAHNDYDGSIDGLLSFTGRHGRFGYEAGMGAGYDVHYEEVNFAWTLEGRFFFYRNLFLAGSIGMPGGSRYQLSPSILLGLGLERFTVSAGVTIYECEYEFYYAHNDDGRYYYDSYSATDPLLTLKFTYNFKLFK
jgi:hypothetical protein